VGFTRLMPTSSDLQGEYQVMPAALGLLTDWLPATEIRGEGVFVRLDEGRLEAWARRPAVRAREDALRAGFLKWCEAVKEPPAFPGARFYLLHSLSHLLMTALSLECGYAASAIRERIYCSLPDDPVPMAGILLATGSSGTEGTLGGLVEQGRHIGRHLRAAWDLGALCSNDPVCGHHTPRGEQTGRLLEGAACHGCLFVAECSCERFNQYLDRALVVPDARVRPRRGLLPAAPVSASVAGVAARPRAPRRGARARGGLDGAVVRELLRGAQLEALAPHLGGPAGARRGHGAGGVGGGDRRAASPSPTRVSLVWTGPETRASAARDTAVVVRDLFEGASGMCSSRGTRSSGARRFWRRCTRRCATAGVAVEMFVHLDGAETPPIDAVVYLRTQAAAWRARYWPSGRRRRRCT
jgi:hypothetical protein